MKDRLKRLLEDKHMTQAEFADYIGVVRSSITHIMTGRNATSQTVVSNTLLHFPEVNPMWLLKGEGEMYRENVERTVVSQKNVPTSNIQSKLFSEEELLEDTSSTTEVIPQSISAEQKPINHDKTITLTQPKIEEIVPKVKEQRNIKLDKKLKKIVFFYSDRSFEEFLPSEE